MGQIWVPILLWEIYTRSFKERKTTALKQRDVSLKGPSAAIIQFALRKKKTFSLFQFDLQTWVEFPVYDHLEAGFSHLCKMETK